MEILDTSAPPLFSLRPRSRPPSDAAADDLETAVAGLFVLRYTEMTRLASLLGADDPEDIAQEAFARLLKRYGTLRDADAAVAYVRATVCNLARSRHRHLRVARLRAPAPPGHAPSAEHAMLQRADHQALRQALMALPARRREAIVLRYWLGLSEAETALAMGVSPGTVKSQVSRGLTALGKALEERS
jgi:RNA polymerase sigma-70 factor (sigma-E family)